MFLVAQHTAISSHNIGISWNTVALLQTLRLCEPNACGGFLRECFACRKQINLQQLSSLQYQHNNITGAEMAASVEAQNSWTQRLVFKDIAVTGLAAQASQEACRKYLIDLANTGPVKAGFSLPQNKLFVDKYAKSRAGQGLAAKPTMDAAQVPSFLAEHDSTNNPFSNMHIISKDGSVVMGTPTAAIYAASKPKDSQKVAMAAFIESNEAGIEGRTEADIIYQMHTLCMKQAAEEMTARYVTEGESLSLLHVNINHCWAHHLLFVATTSTPTALLSTTQVRNISVHLIIPVIAATHKSIWPPPPPSNMRHHLTFARYTEEHLPWQPWHHIPGLASTSGAGNLVQEPWTCVVHSSHTSRGRHAWQDAFHPLRHQRKLWCPPPA